MTTKNLLVELFVEELPPKALKKLGEAFAGVLFEQLKAQGLVMPESALTSFASPRRLAAHVTYVAEQAVDKAVSQKLMPVAVGLDADGSATPALLKKLAALGADASSVAGLKRAPDGKAEALFYDSLVKGATLAEGLQKALLEAIAKLPIPKVMTYQLADGWSDVKFVRPAHGLVALHGSDVVAIEALGLQAGNTTHGHRFEATVDPIVLQHADSYAATLQKDGAVIASFAERKAEIARQLAAAATRVGSGATAIDDDALLDEVTALVERPNVLICEFEKEFLDVPQECLILTMKANQKYFPLLDANGKLTNKFLVVSNITPTDASAVIGGNERVVRPRLADAKFFFDQDRKKTLASRVAGLDKVVYHNKLGSQGERITRVRAIAKAIGQQLGGDSLAQKADQAAMLAKTDLVTDMVGEFPELQGTMGRYYAINDGLSLEVADAIEDHYKPRFASDTLPRNDVGVVVALADKLETLVGMFGIGNLPTGDKDPFALRRHALGAIRMLVEQELPFTVYEVVGVAVNAFPQNLIQQAVDGIPLSYRLSSFLEERATGYLRDLSYTAQEASALFSLGVLPSVRLLPSQYFSRLDAIREAELAFPADLAALANADKRARNILTKSGGTSEFLNADEALMSEDAEKNLLHKTREIRGEVDKLVNLGQFKDALLLTIQISKPVTAFFNSVMVNAENEEVRLNRFRLLHEVTGLTNRVVDLSKLAT